MFTVFIHTDNVTRHRVLFGNVENMTAHVLYLKSHIYTCNRFFAVFLKFSNWSWDLLSPLDVNPPYLQTEIYSKEKECFATEDSMQTPPNPENIVKLENYSVETQLREEKQEEGKRQRINNLVEFSPGKSWN